MKMKTILKYLFYVLLIYGLIYLKGYVADLFAVEYQNYYHINTNYLLIGLGINIIIGLLLGFEHLLGQMKNDGRWGINRYKLTLIGLPSLFFSLNYMLSLINISWMQQILNNIILFHKNNDYITIFQIILGYVIITSIYRKSDHISYNTRALWDVYNQY